MKFWRTARRELALEKTLVMAVINVTPDSFSDGGNFFSIGDALAQAEKLIAEGADILDIGGESTRPNAERIETAEEIRRVVPLIEKLTAKFDTPVSIDTSKSEVAEKALAAGAEIINDIAGLRFDERIAKVAAATNAGLILMHSRGAFAAMHRQMPVKNILSEVADGLRESVKVAADYGIKNQNIALDVGIGFSKTFAQNLELLANLDKIISEFPESPMLVGTSRKSFIGKVLDDAPVENRLFGTLAANAIAVWNGAKILRVHDVRETVETVKMIEAIKMQRKLNRSSDI